MKIEVLFQLNLNPELPPEIQELAVQKGEDDFTKYALIEQLRSLIIQKGKFTPHRMDDEYLMKFLRARSWEVKESYQLLSNYCDYREKNRNYYENVSCVELMALVDDKLLSITPYRDRIGRRILIIRYGTWDPTRVPVEDFFRLVTLMVEMGSMEPISQVTGGIIIVDLGGVNMNHMLHLSPSVAQKTIALVETSTPLRGAAIHVVHQNWFFNAILNMFKPFLGNIREILFIHGSDMSCLHKHIDPKCLPERYGGIHEDHPYAKWSVILKQDAKINRQLQQLGYNVDTME